MAAGTKAFSIARLRGEKIAQDFKLAAREIGLTDAAEDGGCGPAEVSGRNRESAWVGGGVALILFRLSFSCPSRSYCISSGSLSVREDLRRERFAKGKTRGLPWRVILSPNSPATVLPSSLRESPVRAKPASNMKKARRTGSKHATQTQNYTSKLCGRAISPEKKTHMDSVFGQKSTVMCCGIK